MGLVLLMASLPVSAYKEVTMYIKVNNLDYPCRERRVENGTISFLGVTGLTMPISGTVQLCRNDGFILAEDNTED